MLYLSLILILLPSIKALSCSNLYDYTGDTIKCTASCPPGSKLVNNNKCLSNNQYLLDQEVHLCNRGWVDYKNTVCCPQSNFIYISNNIASCQKCETRVYLKGTLCCPASQYADLTNINKPICTPLGTGLCNNLTFKSLFQVCCPSGQFYNIEQQTCVNPASYNCNNTQKVCCKQGNKLDNINNQLVCVGNCGWSDKNQFFCRKKYCNNYGQSLQASLAHYNAGYNIKLSLSSCCYGLDVNGGCIIDPALCMKRFINRGWAVCCQPGQFYSIKNNQCNLMCDGIILFQFFCIQQGNILNFQSNNGQPIQSPAGTLCNNKKVSPLYPVCCPFGFYINGTNGCQYCNGRIFTAIANQICCGYSQIYNADLDVCEPCNGIISKQGTLCCSTGQYIAYSTSGDATCVDTCALQKMYKTDTCCDSLGNTCQNSVILPTICNPSYFIEGACQACPTFCSISAQLTQMCASGSFDQCQKKCSTGTIYSTDLQQCLACDPSCQECSQPFDSQYCTNCVDGYVFLQGLCNRCAPQCITCSMAINTCLSCPQNSSRPVLSNGRCIPTCDIGQYFQISTAGCLSCSNLCIQCTGSDISQCSKCGPSSILILGTCSSCSNGCITCYFKQYQCYQCQSNYVLDANNQCTNSCPSGYFKYFDVSLGHGVCLTCHISCNDCINQAQNCISCTNNSYYLDNQLGLNLCSLCNLPCTTCTNATYCLSCQNGYYLQNNTCLKCQPSCLTCSTGSINGCLSCYGQSQLQNGKCKGCSSSCSQCDTNKINCVNCQSPFYIYIGYCVQKCPQSTYLSENACLDCLVNCSSCENNSSCINCSLSYPISFNGSCLKTCPDGYSAQSNSCVIVNNYTNDNTDQNNISPTIKSQQIKMSPSGNTMVVLTTLDTINQNLQLTFYLVNTKTAQKTKLSASKILSTQSILLMQSNNNTNLTYNVSLPQNGISLKDSILLTSVDGNFNSSTYYNPKSIWSFILYDYRTNPLMGLQYVGLSFTILILIYSLVSKIKGHFIAEQANTIILHMLNFIQVVYLFKFTQLHTQGMYHFLNGFGFMHLLMFPNFFYNLIPSQYVEYPVQKSLIPDGNFIRNAGSSISFQLIILALMLLACIISFAVYKGKDLLQMPQIRKITRIGLLGIQITFLNIAFTSINYLIQPFITNNPSFSSSSKIASIIMFIITCLIMLLVFVHFYKTYNSDVLQHYYTLRQGCHYIIILCQAFIFTFAIGKPLLCLFLIPIQLIWFVFNYMLYKYGEGDRIGQHVKFIISTVCVVIAYLFLSLAGYINWIFVVVIVSIVVVVLIVYSSYQVIGLYYRLFFKDQVKTEDAIQNKQLKIEGIDKQSESRL